MVPFRSTPPTGRRVAANLLAFAACIAMLGVALYQQHVLGRSPCHLCILQRIAVLGAGLLFLAAALHRPAALGARMYAIAIAIVAGAGFTVAARNVWIQLQPPGAVPACSADLNVLVQMMPLHEALAKVFMAGGDCQQVYTFLGVALPVWVLVAMLGLAAWAWVWNVTFGPLPRRDAAERLFLAARRS